MNEHLTPGITVARACVLVRPTTIDHNCIAHNCIAHDYIDHYVGEGLVALRGKSAITIYAMTI